MGLPEPSAAAPNGKPNGTTTSKQNGVTPAKLNGTTTTPPAPTIHDLSHPLTSGAVPSFHFSHPSFCCTPISRVSAGDVSTVHALSLGTHTGTHIDAPSHFFADGATVDKLDLGWVTAAPAVVVDCRGKTEREMIMWEDLVPYVEGQGRHPHAPTQRLLGKGTAVLFLTGWSRHWNTEHYPTHPYLCPNAARRLMALGVRVVGVDAMSPDLVLPGTGDALETHKAILGAGGVIVENLRGLEGVFEQLGELEEGKRDLRHPNPKPHHPPRRLPIQKRMVDVRRGVPVIGPPRAQEDDCVFVAGGGELGGVGGEVG
ncbi:hypothetical protein EIP91_001588, partial [Steccherinum ochraceum]